MARHIKLKKVEGLDYQEGLLICVGGAPMGRTAQAMYENFKLIDKIKEAKDVLILDSTEYATILQMVEAYAWTQVNTLTGEPVVMPDELQRVIVQFRDDVRDAEDASDEEDDKGNGEDKKKEGKAA